MTTIPTTRIGHVALITPDLDRARRFYEDVIGLRTMLVSHPQGAPFRRLAALTDTTGDAGAVLLFEVPGYESGLPDDIIGRRGRVDHVAYVVGDDDQFDVVRQRLVDAGASTGQVDLLGPTKSVLFVDPDGGHHNLQTHTPAWRPEPSDDVLDADLLARTFGLTTT